MRRLILGAHKEYTRLDGDVTIEDLRPHSLLHSDWPAGLHDMFTSIHAIHVVEKVNSLVEFMDSAWLCLTKGGSLHIETPVAGGDADRQYSDPTVIRCYRPNTFNYFTPEGVEVHGYTDKAWAIVNIGIDKSIIKVTLTPIK